MAMKETLSMLYGELMDLIACSQIASGKARQKHTWTFEEAMALE